MKFIKGGELFRHLVEVKHFKETDVKFFTLQVALALGHLHEKKIVYRDLKPENILVGEDGYVLVADFGLAKLIKDGEATSTFCGTPEYLAPEILEGKSYAHPVDWWALGTLMYEMLIGIPPFYHHKQHRMYRMIRKHEVSYPDAEKHGIYVSDDAKDLIGKLLMKSPEERIGTAGGMEEILAHKWFADLDREAVYKKSMPSPYVPKVQGDLAYFDPALVIDGEVKSSMVPSAQ